MLATLLNVWVVATGRAIAVVFFVLFGVAALGTIRVMPQAYEPMRIAGGTLTVPKFGLARRSRTTTYDLAEFQHGGVVGLRARRRSWITPSLDPLWRVALWKDSRTAPVLLPFAATGPRSTPFLLARSFGQHEAELAGSPVGQIAQLFDRTLAALHPDAPEPRPNAVRGYLYDGMALAWIPSLGWAAENGSSASTQQ